MKRGRFHLVHTHSSKAGILGRLAARRAGVPCVVHTVHGWGFHEHMSPPKRALYVGLEKRALRWTDRLVSVSNETTRVGLAAGIGRAADYTLIRSGIPLDRFGPDAERRRVMRAELGYADDDVVIISVGRLSAQKNPMDFVELAERLAEAAPRAKFLYVGDGPLRGEVEARLAGGTVADRVRLAGLRRDVPDLMRASDLFVLTSLWEGLPRVAPQALATGLPVFAYDVAGTREIVRNGENGALVAPRDVGALVERLIPLATEPSRLRELSERTVAGFDRSFSEDAMIAALEQLYDGLIAEKSARV
jgi:glycosyltransferase involved in cell wall biosynthesis